MWKFFTDFVSEENAEAGCRNCNVKGVIFEAMRLMFIKGNVAICQHFEVLTGLSSDGLQIGIYNRRITVVG